MRYNLKTNEPVTPPSSLLSLNYHIVDERHSTDDHVGRVGNDDTKDYNIHEVGMGIKSLFLFNYDNDRNIDDIDGLYYDDDGTEDDNNDIFDKYSKPIEFMIGNYSNVFNDTYRFNDMLGGDDDEENAVDDDSDNFDKSMWILIKRK